MSFFVVGARAKTMSFNKRKKESGDRSGKHGGCATSLSRPIHFIQGIDARTDVLFVLMR